MNTARKRRRLLRLWEDSPLCHWCKEATVCVFRPFEKNKGGKFRPRPDEATLDHIHTRLEPERYLPVGKNGHEVVLSCWQCNATRNQEEQREMPIEVLRMLSRRSTRTRIGEA